MAKSLVERIEECVDLKTLNHLVRGADVEEVRDNKRDLRRIRDNLKRTAEYIDERVKDSEKIYREPIPYNEEYFRINPNEISQKLNSRQYLTELAKEYELGYNELINRKTTLRRKNEKTSTLRDALEEATYTLKTRYKMSFPQIGKILGGRHHTTIMVYYRGMCEKLGIDSNCMPKAD